MLRTFGRPIHDCPHTFVHRPSRWTRVGRTIALPSSVMDFLVVRGPKADSTGQSTAGLGRTGALVSEVQEASDEAPVTRADTTGQAADVRSCLWQVLARRVV